MKNSRTGRYSGRGSLQRMSRCLTKAVGCCSLLRTRFVMQGDLLASEPKQIETEQGTGGNDLNSVRERFAYLDSATTSTPWSRSFTASEVQESNPPTQSWTLRAPAKSKTASASAAISQHHWQKNTKLGDCFGRFRSLAMSPYFNVFANWASQALRLFALLQSPVRSRRSAT